MDCLNLLPIESPLPDGLLPQIPIPFIGGNLPPLGGCKKKYTEGGVDRLARSIRRSEPKVVRALKRIHRLSPDARVLLVDYMRVIPDHACYPLVPAVDKDMRYIKTKFDQLNAMLKRAARKGGAELVEHRRPDPRPPPVHGGADAVCRDPRAVGQRPGHRRPGPPQLRGRAGAGRIGSGLPEETPQVIAR